MEQKTFKFDEGSRIFFTSDTHYGHENIIHFCKRPFASVKEMDAYLIDRWNNVVGPNDYIFHLGDFCFKGSQYWDNILNQLNGHKFLIIGNHDEKNLRDGAMYKFDWVGFQAIVLIGSQKIYLNHHPFLCYGGTYHDNPTWQLFGHVHSGPGANGKDINRMQYLFPTQYDVGVDNNNFTPVSFEQIKTIIDFQINGKE